MTIGNKEWAFTDGWIPPLGDETVAFLNFSFLEAHVEIMVYYSTRDPVGPYRLTVPPGRLKCVRFNCLKDPEPIPRATDYATTIESDVPIVVQHRGSPSCVPSYDSRDHQTSSNARSMNRRN
jgi:hypothetical protein